MSNASPRASEQCPPGAPHSHPNMPSTPHLVVSSAYGVLCLMPPSALTRAPPTHLVASSAYGVLCLMPPSALTRAPPTHLVASSAYGVLCLMLPSALTSAPPCPERITERRYSHSDNAGRGRGRSQGGLRSASLRVTGNASTSPPQAPQPPFHTPASSDVSAWGPAAARCNTPYLEA